MEDNRKVYGADDEAMKLYDELMKETNERSLLHEEAIPATIDTVTNLRDRRASGETQDELFAGMVLTDHQKEVAPKFIAALDADIANEGADIEDTANEEKAAE